MNWINIVAYVLALGFIGVLIAIVVSEIKKFAEKVNHAFDKLDKLNAKMYSTRYNISCIDDYLEDVKRYISEFKTENENNDRSINDITTTVSNLVKRVNELENQEVENADKG